MDVSSNPSRSSRRQGFRWSYGSSCDLGFDGENFDVMENVQIEYFRSPNDVADNYKCEICSRLMRHKFMWCSYAILRGKDMPIAGVLCCGHVFHAECLEHVTPKNEIHDPPCPLCTKTLDVVKETTPVPEPLQVSLKSVQKDREILISKNLREDDIDQRLEKESAFKNHTNSMKSNFKKTFTFRGKSGKDLFRTKLFRKSSSSAVNRDIGGGSISSRK